MTRSEGGAVALEATARFRTAREALFEATVHQVGAHGVRRTAYADLVDGWLVELYAAAAGRGTAGEPERPVALAAVGGHGRRELAPGSDLDLVLIGNPRDTAAVADALWYPIWDSGLRLDHSVRTIDQAVTVAREDVRAGLGLLDVRHVAGDPIVTATLRERWLRTWRASALNMLPELRAMGNRRAQQQGHVAWLLEPDLKDSYGGIREATVLRAIAASWVADVPHGDAARAHAHLLDVRDELHLVTGRTTDRLVLQEQPAIAAVMGYENADALLRSVGAAGRSLSYALDVAWHRVDQAAPAKRSRLSLKGRGREVVRTPLADGVVEQGGEVVLAREADLEDPTLGLRAAAAAAQNGLRLAPVTVERIAASQASLPAPWPRSAREAFVSLLGAGPAAVPVWEALDQAGIWSRWIDGWSRLRGLPQHNPVHRFTVDRHLVEAAVQAAALTRRVNRPDLLLVGALLHDVGKGLPGDHTEQGIPLVATMARAMGFDADDVAVIVDLCRHHLLLPDTATRRDLEDPATVAGVVEQMRSSALSGAEMLDLVAALSEADAKATGPAAWTEWRAALINELAERAHAVMRGEVREPEPPLGSGGRDRMATDGLIVEVVPDRSAWQVTVVADDRPGLMADVAGVLSVNRLAVRAARLHTQGARALQIWTVQPMFGDPPGAARLRSDLMRAFEDRLDLAARLLQRDEAYAGVAIPVAEPSVLAIEGASRDASVIEVRAHDGAALLHRIGAALAGTGVAVRSARVSTMGSEAVDVFYVTDAYGAALDDAALARLVDSVQGALSGPASQEQPSSLD